MDFKKATDQLFRRLDHADLAKVLGVSVASIRQARLQVTAKARREPPADWPDAIIRLAEDRMAHYRNLVDALKGVRKRRIPPLRREAASVPEHASTERAH
jgi:hypothetical protein